MAKAQKLIIKELKLVDIAIEMIDARIPISSRNPDVDTIVGGKKRVILLNKCDLADEGLNKQWESYFSNRGIKGILVNSVKGTGIKSVLNECKNLMEEDIIRLRKKGLIHKTIRAIVIGIPNVGKSSFINRMVNKSIAQTGGKPGVTKIKQWIKVSKDLELLDTPGILWPKFGDETVALNLAYTGAVKDEIMDINELAKKFTSKAIKEFPDKFNDRYKFNCSSYSAEECIKIIGEKRGCMLTGGEIDINRASDLIMEDFRKGKLGRISLEKPYFKEGKENG